MKKIIFSSLLIGLFLSSCNSTKTENTDSAANSNNNNKRIQKSRQIMYLDSSGAANFLFSSGKIKILIEKIYAGVVAGKVESYLDDSLKTKLSTADAKMRGSVTNTLEIPVDETGDRTTLKDTVAYFDAKDLKCFYSLENLEVNNLEGILNIIAIGPAFHREVMGSLYYGPLFYIKTADLDKILTAEEKRDLIQFCIQATTVQDMNKKSEL